MNIWGEDGRGNEWEATGNRKSIFLLLLSNLLVQESVYITGKHVRFANAHSQGNTSHHFFNKTRQYTHSMVGKSWQEQGVSCARRGGEVWQCSGETHHGSFLKWLDQFVLRCSMVVDIPLFSIFFHSWFFVSVSSPSLCLSFFFLFFLLLFFISSFISVLCYLTLLLSSPHSSLFIVLTFFRPPVRPEPLTVSINQATRNSGRETTGQFHIWFPDAAYIEQLYPKNEHTIQHVAVSAVACCSANLTCKCYVILLLVHVTTIIKYQYVNIITSSGKMIIFDELIGIWKEAAVACFKKESQYVLNEGVWDGRGM
jgi:hypothetical protein